MANHVEQVIKDHIMKEFMYDKPDIVLDNDFPLTQEGVIDSLGIFMLIGFIEKEFGVKVAPEEVVPEHFETINAITELVTTKLSSQP